MSVTGEDCNVDIPPNRPSVFRSTSVKPYLESDHSGALSDDEDETLPTLEPEPMLRRRGRPRKNPLPPEEVEQFYSDDVEIYIGSATDQGQEKFRDSRQKEINRLIA